jgi:catechol 2,3-dioxygenase-like lactoylglutathione lyase family enzyme
MSLLSGVNHITFLTSDLDRLAAFHKEVFGARKLVELPVPEPEGPGRHALITLGAGANLPAFELSKTPPPPARPMFERGRSDHFALHLADVQTFERLRKALLDRGLTDGTVTDFGALRVLTFEDPDGHSVELAHWVGAADPADLICRGRQTRRSSRGGPAPATTHHLAEQICRSLSPPGAAFPISPARTQKRVPPRALWPPPPRHERDWGLRRAFRTGDRPARRSVQVRHLGHRNARNDVKAGLWSVSNSLSWRVALRRGRGDELNRASRFEDRP